jgi:hypothetical protein
MTASWREPNPSRTHAEAGWSTGRRGTRRGSGARGRSAVSRVRARDARRCARPSSWARVSWVQPSWRQQRSPFSWSPVYSPSRPEWAGATARSLSYNNRPPPPAPRPATRQERFRPAPPLRPGVHRSFLPIESLSRAPRPARKFQYGRHRTRSVRRNRPRLHHPLRATRMSPPPRLLQLLAQRVANKVSLRCARSS